MKKKSLLCVLLASLTLGISCASSTNEEGVDPIVTDNEEEPESCTVMYVGKDVSKTNRAMIARSSDSGPYAMNMNLLITEHNALANKIVDGNNGFTYQMPNTTYRYISTPRNPNINKGHHWEASAINENGVGISATLSCATNNEAEKADPLVKDGISEDNIAQILGATATSARDAMETLADIIDYKGSCDPNIVMAIDQNEAWLMEMYTGHQYYAFKLPDDKACTIGNEFFVNTIEEINPTDEIRSTELISLPERKGFAQYDEDGHLHLFNTYAEALDDGEGRISSDNSHRRTWRGRSLFDPDNPLSQSYDSVTKYPAFFTPKNRLGKDDIIRFMRDRFEDLIGKEGFELFTQDYQNGVLRNVAIENAYQIHIIESDPSLNKKIATTEWLCLSNSNYAPFIPINNGINSASKYYTHVSRRYGYDLESAEIIFKRVNALAAISREKYGKPVQHMWEDYEARYEEQYQHLLNDSKTLSLNEAKNAITNYCNSIQNEVLAVANNLYEDLTFQLMNDQRSYKPGYTTFVPLVNIHDYIANYGWDTYHKEGNIVTIKHDSNKATIDLKEGIWNQKGNITYQDQVKDLEVKLTNNGAYANKEILDSVLKQFELVLPNAKDYLNSFNHLVWIIPISVIAGAIILILIPIVIVKKREA